MALEQRASGSHISAQVALEKRVMHFTLCGGKKECDNVEEKQFRNLFLREPFEFLFDSMYSRKKSNFKVKKETPLREKGRVLCKLKNSPFSSL